MAHLWLQRALRLTPDMIVADITMPVMHGHSGANTPFPANVTSICRERRHRMKLPPSY
jgi:hypothetical protein